MASGDGKPESDAPPADPYYRGPIRPVSSTARPANASLGVSRHTFDNMAKSPETRPAQPSASTAAAAARPGLGGMSSSSSGGDISEAERQRRAAENKYPSGTRPASSSDSAGATTSSHVAHAGAHHHHHHHHHHIHSHSSASPSATPAAGGSRDTPSADRPSSSAAAGGTNGGPPRPASASSGATANSLNRSTYGLPSGWGGMMQMDYERRERERKAKERQMQLDKEKSAQASSTGPTSPVARTAASPFGRPPGPTSPTAPSRATPAPASAKTSLSPTMSSASTQAARPNLPLPGFGSLGARALPSPFGADRSSSTPAPAASGHNRSLSGSSTRAEANETSPSRTTTALGQSAATSGRNSIGITYPSRPDSSQAPAAAKPETPASSNPAAGAATSGRQAYPNYTSYNPPYMGFGSGFGGYGGFSGTTWSERERMKAREREREREKEREKERERLAEADRRELERRKQQQQAASARTPFGSGYQSSSYNRPAASASSAPPSRIEVIHAPPKTQEQMPPAQYAPTNASNDASVIQQVVPSREPRPYTYTAKNEIPPAVAPAIAKDYNYNPREQPKDKRPRMDAAVDDARRGQAKAKRRKEDDKRSPPYGHQTTTRDLSSLTREVRQWPEVTSGLVENWLKSEADLSRVVANEVYQGADWTLAQTRGTERSNEGGLVMVQINGAFLGSSWVVRGEKGWDDATPYPSAEVELGRGIKTRKIWGTDVYTDDSDLGLVLLHAGWIRWSNSEVKKEDAVTTNDRDVIEVSVRVVPQLVRYTATERNGVRTRAWGNGHDGSSIVVEGVKRITIYRKALKGRANRKQQLAEMARQRLAVMGPPEEGKRAEVEDGLPPIIWTRQGPAFRYSKAAIMGCMDWKPIHPKKMSRKLARLEPRKPEGDEEEHPPYTLYDYDLELINGDNRYLVHSDNVEFEEIEMSICQFKKKDWGRTIEVAAALSDDEIVWAADGLALDVEEPDFRGLFIPCQGYAWRKRTEDDDYVSTAGGQEDWLVPSADDLRASVRMAAEVKAINPRSTLVTPVAPP